MCRRFEESQQANSETVMHISEVPCLTSSPAQRLTWYSAGRSERTKEANQDQASFRQ